MNIIRTKKSKIRATRAFLKKGTCSRAFFFVFNREFDNLKDDEERAVDPLAGGILQQGYQCGMLWGSSLGLGAESFRRSGNLADSIPVTIQATKLVMDSFENRNKTIACGEITKTDFNNGWSFAKYMLSGKFTSCFRMAGKWAPEAVDAAYEGLAQKSESITEDPISCASEVVKKMGGTDEEAAMVAGFAGGLGLSGDGCGALAAALWMNNLTESIRKTGKSMEFKPDNNIFLTTFYNETDYEMECSSICGKKFNSVDEHSKFIKNGGCSKLIQTLASIS